MAIKRPKPEEIVTKLRQVEFLMGKTCPELTQPDISASWFCPAYVPVSELTYAAFRSNAKGLLPPSDECLRLGL